jgi:hypothetical protein
MGKIPPGDKHIFGMGEAASANLAYLGMAQISVHLAMLPQTYLGRDHKTSLICCQYATFLSAPSHCTGCSTLCCKEIAFNTTT